MQSIILDPAPTLDEALSRVHDKVLPDLPEETRKTAMDFAAVYHTAGAAWAASRVIRDVKPDGERRAPSPAALAIQVEAEKIIAQACPPKAPDGASN